MDEKPEIQSFELEFGELRRIGSNKPVKFLLRTASGTIVSGVITPNNPLEVTNGGDIEEFTLEIRNSLATAPYLSSNDT